MYWRECALGGGNVRFLRKSGGFVKPLYIYIYMYIHIHIYRYTHTYDIVVRTVLRSPISHGASAVAPCGMGMVTAPVRRVTVRGSSTYMLFYWNVIDQSITPETKPLW